MPTWNVWEEVQKQTTCAHEHSRATRATKSNGVVCVYIQCTACGEKVKEVSKKDFNVNILPSFNENLRTIMRERSQAVRDEVRDRWQEEYDRERENKDSEFWKAYTIYLNSEHWRNLRRIVLKRDECRCQNCFCSVSESSAHVHHTSYVGFQRLGYSFAFECVTLCRDCHSAYHGNQDHDTITRRQLVR